MSEPLVPTDPNANPLDLGRNVVGAPLGGNAILPKPGEAPPVMQNVAAPAAAVPAVPTPAFAPTADPKGLLQRTLPEIASSSLFRQQGKAASAAIESEFMAAAGGKLTLDQIKSPFLKQTLTDISQRDPARWRRIQQEASVPAMAARQAAVAEAVRRPSAALGGASVAQAVAGDAYQPAMDRKRDNQREANRQLAIRRTLDNPNLPPEKRAELEAKIAQSPRVADGELKGRLKHDYATAFPTQKPQWREQNPAQLIQPPAIGGGAPTTDPYAQGGSGGVGGSNGVMPGSQVPQVDAAKVTLDQWVASVPPEQMDEIRSAMVSSNTAAGRQMGEIMQARAMMYNQQNLTPEDLSRMEDTLNRREMAITYGFARSGMMQAIQRSNALKQQAVDAERNQKMELEKEKGRQREREHAQAAKIKREDDDREEAKKAAKEQEKEKKAEAERKEKETRDAAEDRRKEVLSIAKDIVKDKQAALPPGTAFDAEAEFTKALSAAKRRLEATDRMLGASKPKASAGTDESPSADPQSRRGGWKMPVKQGGDGNWYPQPTTQAELDAVPKGTKYMRGDGRVFVKN